MKNRPIQICLLVSAMAFSAAAVGQNNDNASLYAAFDKTVQVKNAAFNNGKIHFNPFRSIDKTYRYYNSSEFLKGEILFDRQLYQNLSLKYDLLKDELIIKFEGEGNKMGFSPVKQLTEAFSIGGIKFRNLDLTAHPNFISGFYEETDAGKLSLYTKYAKDQFASLTNEQVFYTYVARNEFALLHQDTFYQIANERDAAKAFPQFETQIAEFFRNNAPLEQSDRRQFMKKLVFHLAQLLNAAPK